MENSFLGTLSKYLMFLREPFFFFFFVDKFNSYHGGVGIYILDIFIGNIRMCQLS